ncbi:TIM protein, partial [Halcyon senegalensis]|nr:TIM protein [Halcyon senegalensis]
VEELWAPEEGAGQGLVPRLHQEGLAGPLRWLENCLRRAAGDREEDGVSHPVPLVPLSEENEDAMEDQRFLALLRQLGLRPPANEQESFWRIPAALTPRQLRRAAASIAHHSPNPSESPQGQLDPPQYPAPGEGWGWGGSGPLPSPTANPCPHCCREEPVPVPGPSPVQPGTKRRRELSSEDEEEGEGSSGAFSLSWGG